MPAAVVERRTKRRRIRRGQYSGRRATDSEKAFRGVSGGSLLVAAAVPLLFLHSSFQPSVSVHLAGTSIDAYLSDFAVLAVVVAALVALVRHGAGPLRYGLVLWAAIAGFFLWTA